jgi:hypothetical protein
MAVFMVWPKAVMAQKGNNAVYPAGGGACCTPSASFVDASAFVVPNNGDTICSIIYVILANPVYSAAVIDARSLSTNPNVSMTCANGTTPWNNGSGLINKPSTILLPSGVISTFVPWVLPNQTHLVGQGDTATLTTTSGTVIKAKANFSGAALIQFGDSTISPCCTEISVEKLSLNGDGETINGIINQYSQDFSYVDHVGLYQILGVGLMVSGSASESGPYSNINFDTGNSSGSSSTSCVNINGVSTRGVRALSCVSETINSAAAVLLDASNNSLEDVRIMGFLDGVRVGANAVAKSNVLVNILGDTHYNGSVPPPIYTVHIEPGTNVRDLTIVGAGNSAISGTFTIYDELTGIHLQDSTVGMYVLGEAANNGVSFFTTSPHAPSWATGKTYPGNSIPCAQGSIYSCTGTSSNCNNKALWGCPHPGGNWQGIL